MNAIAYLNGRFLPLEDAHISPMDRGFLFGDGVYEVIPVFHGKLFCLTEHLDRLNQSLQGIRMSPPHSHSEWQTLLETLVEKNNAKQQWLYLQVTRGVDKVRDHQFPKPVVPTVFAVSYPKVFPSKQELAQGIKATGVRDIRWKQCAIKTTARIAYVLMYQEAIDNGFDEGIILNNGYAFEGTSSNLFIVRHGVIITPPKSSLLLSGITRDKILLLAEKNNIPYREVKISERDLLKADEMWITSSTRGIYPVTEFSGNPVGNGQAGPLWNRMWDLYDAATTDFSLCLSH